MKGIMDRRKLLVVFFCCCVFLSLCLLEGENELTIFFLFFCKVICAVEKLDSLKLGLSGECLKSHKFKSFWMLMLPMQFLGGQQ